MQLLTNLAFGITLLITIILLLICAKNNDGFMERFSFKYLKGDTRWSKRYELTKRLKKINLSDNTYKYGGIPLISNSRNVWVDNNEGHSLIIGTTGSGKTRRIVNPMIKILAKRGESMIITDPKMELYYSSIQLLKDEGYKTILLNFRDPEYGDGWNPLNIPYDFYKNNNIDKCVEFLEALAVNIFYTDFYSNMFPMNSYLEKAAADYFCALALCLFEEGDVDEINLNSIAYLSTLINNEYQDTTYLKKYFEIRGRNHPGYFFAQGIMQTDGENKNQILTTFIQRIRIFISRKSLSKMMSSTDFDFKSICETKTAIFIILHDEKTTYHTLASIFIKQCYEYLIYCSQNTGSLNIRLNFILEEFGNMPPIPDFPNMITASRSRNMRFNLIIQGISQLDVIYKYENSATIQGNCSNILCLLTSEQNSLEKISNLCGEKIIRDDVGKVIEKKPLISITDLQKMNTGDVIIIKHSLYPYRTKLPDQSKYIFDNVLVSTNEIRCRKEVKIFNISKMFLQ